MSDDRAREGVEHLQNAARELIAAARAFLDVAEEVVDDPGSLGAFTATLSDLADLATGRAGAAPTRHATRDADGDAADPGTGGDGSSSKRVQRIPVV